MIRAIIFDFDGVIAESATVKTEAFRALFAEHEQHVAAIVALHEREAGRSRFWKFETIYRTILQLPLSEETSQDLGRRFSELALQGVLDAPLVNGFLEFLESNAGQRSLYIASGTPHDELHSILQQRQLAHHFQGIFGSPRCKGEIARSILAEGGYLPHEVLFVGDALADQQGAREAGVFFLGRCPPGQTPPWVAARCLTDLAGLARAVQQFDRGAPVSVAVCTFNGLSRGYLFQALDSIQSQTVYPEELLVVDDGSADDTVAAVAERYPDVRIFSQPNRGLAEARNLAIRSTTCAYLAFLDDDDTWVPEKLERQLARQAAVVFTGLTLLDGAGQACGERRAPALLEWPEILLGNHVTGPSSVLLARWLVDRVGSFRPGLGGTEDYDYWIRCARHAVLVGLDQALVGYRIHDGQMSVGYAAMAAKALEVVDEHARTGGHSFHRLVLRYNAYGVAFMGLAGRRHAARVGWEWARRQGLDPLLFLVRLVGMALKRWPPLQVRFRVWEMGWVGRRLRRLECRP